MMVNDTYSLEPGTETEPPSPNTFTEVTMSNLLVLANAFDNE